MSRSAWLSALVITAITVGAAFAQPPGRGSAGSRGMINDRYYEKIATEWVQLYLKRNPTAQEVLLIKNQLRSGASGNAVQANILGSDEYYRRVNRNLNTWSQSVVQDVLGRRITAYELGLLQRTAFNSGRNAAALMVLDSRSSWSSPPWWWGW